MNDHRPPRALFLVAASLERDIALASAAGIELCVAGVGRRGDENARRAIDGTRAELVLNIGFAGGLVQDALPGSLHVVRHWVAGPGRGTDERGPGLAAPTEIADLVLEGLRAAGLRPQMSTAITVDTPVGDETRRAELARCGAALVEMEGAAWAAMAGRRGLPFVAVRVVSDRANLRLPRPRHEILRADGTVRWPTWAMATARDSVPWSVAYQRLETARADWAAATATLRRAGTALTRWQLGLRALED